MKTLGLIGGVSWFSTAVYYRLINELTNERLGGGASARLLLYSLNLDDFIRLQAKDDWQEVENILTDIAIKLERAGADCIMMCSNTPHLVADAISQRISIPLLHIAEATAEEIVRQGVSKVGLLGTKFTMEHAFFKERLSRAGIETIIPEPADRDFIHASIVNELTKGIFKEETKTAYIDIIRRLAQNGAAGVVFGCTEIPLLLGQEDCSIAVFDTTAIHSKAAVDFALLGD